MYSLIVTSILFGLVVALIVGHGNLKDGLAELKSEIAKLKAGK